MTDPYLPMPFATPATSSAPAHLGNMTATHPRLGKDVVVQSREMGDVMPNRTQPVGQEEDTKVKPFAHLVAGG